MAQELDFAEQTRVKTRIISLADTGLRNGRPYRLSDLGLHLGSDLRLVKQGGVRLVDFVRHHLSDRYQVITMGEHGNVYALTLKGTGGPPIAAGSGEPPPSLAIVDAADKDDGEGAPKRFHYRFWAAFVVPLGSQVRHLNRQNLTFVDTLAETPLPADTLLITAEDTTSRDCDDRENTVHRKIAAWLERNALNADDFLANKRIPPAFEIASATSAPSTTVLELMISCLDSRQLQHTALSLDVIKAFLRKRV